MAKKLLWVNRIAFDLSLDRTTWMGMANALKDLGVDVTFIALCKNQVRITDEFEHVIWVKPIGTGAIAYLSFLALVWFNTLKWAILEKSDWIILDVSTFFCAFPLDILGRLGLIHLKVILDIRTFHFGSAVQSKLRDWLWELYDNISLVYGRFFHSGLSVIVQALADQARKRGGHSNICIWSSGYSKNSNSSAQLIQDPIINFMADQAKKNVLLMYHGVLYSNRGLCEAIEGTALARSQGCPVFFALFGSGEEADNLKNIIREKGYESCCRVFPTVPYSLVYQLIACAHLGVMTYPPLEYYTYNFPLKLAEYLSMGKPVLCTDLPMFRNAVKDSRCLITISDNSPISIAKKISEVVAHKEDLQARSIIAFKEAENLTWNRQAEKLKNYLESLAR